MGDEVIVGRRAELRRLEDALRAARDGHGSALVVRGEPGVGKSALLGAGMDAAAGLRIVSGVGIESESVLAFAALAALLAPVLDGVEHLPPPQAEAVRVAVGLSSGSGVKRLACYAGVMNLLALAARERPLLVVADDFHWFDRGSQDALLFAARRLADDPVVLWFGVRDGEIDDEALAGLAQLRLQGLEEEAALELLRSVDPGISAPVARQVIAETAGNPLALTEVPRLLSADERDGRRPLSEPLPVGRGLEGAFARRVECLPRACRRALLVAAASFTRAADPITTGLAALGLATDALEPAEEAGLVSWEDGCLVWRHPLVRSAVYHRAPAPERRAAHRALAEANCEGRLSDHRAWHLAAAATGPDETVAALLEQVAHEAQRRGAIATAGRALAQAAALTPGELERARRLVVAAEQAVVVGRWDEATGLLDRLRAHTSDPVLRAQGERIRARVEVFQGAPVAAHDRLVAIAEELIAIDRPLAATIMTEAVVAHMATGDAKAYLATATRAHDLAREVGGLTEAVAALVLGAYLVADSQTDAGMQLLDRARPFAADPALWRAAPEICGMFAFAHIWVERFAEAERLLNAMVETARAGAAVRALAYPLAVRGNLHFRLGRWAAAHADAAESVELAREGLQGAMLAHNLGNLAIIAGALGHGEAARTHAQASLELCAGLLLGAVEPYALLALALLDLSLGENDQAAAWLQRIRPDVVEWATEPGWLHWQPVAIEAQARAGRVAQAEEALAALEAEAARTGRTFAHAASSRCRGLLAGDSEMAEHFERALQWHAQAPLPFERARTELCYGERLRRARRRADAREHLARAAAAFQTLGAAVWAERAEQELAAAGYRPRSGGRPSAWAELTAAETRVAQVIIDGATYEEAASSLFVSPRTIESHLRQIYRKLGVRSRTELTRRLTG